MFLATVRSRMFIANIVALKSLMGVLTSSHTKVYSYFVLYLYYCSEMQAKTSSRLRAGAEGDLGLSSSEVLLPTD